MIAVSYWKQKGGCKCQNDIVTEIPSQIEQQGHQNGPTKLTTLNNPMCLLLPTVELFNFLEDDYSRALHGTSNCGNFLFSH
jgi:hypothetical protein